MSILPTETQKKQRLLLPAAGLILLTLTAVQTGLYLYGYDFSAELYAQGPLPTVTAIIWCLAAIGAGCLAFLLPKQAVCRELSLPHTLFTDYAALFSTGAMVSTVIMPLLARGTSDSLGSLLTSSSVSDNTARTMLNLSLLLGIFAALHYLLRFVYRKNHPLGVSAVLLWTGCTALRIYFDMRYLLMSPRRVLHLVALVAMMIFLIGELRLARTIATPRLYALTALIALFFTGADAISNLILAVMGWVQPGSELSTYLVLLATAIYALARLCALTAPPKKKISPEADSPAPAASPEIASEAQKEPQS